MLHHLQHKLVLTGMMTWMTLCPSKPWPLTHDVPPPVHEPRSRKERNGKARGSSSHTTPPAPPPYIIWCLVCAELHLEHLLFSPPCLQITNGVLVRLLNMSNNHFWLIIEVVHNQPINLHCNKIRWYVAMRLLNFWHQTCMLCHNRTFPVGLPSTLESMYPPRASIVHTLDIIFFTPRLHDSKFSIQRYCP